MRLVLLNILLMLAPFALGQYGQPKPDADSLFEAKWKISDSLILEEKYREALREINNLYYYVKQNPSKAGVYNYTKRVNMLNAAVYSSDLAQAANSYLEDYLIAKNDTDREKIFFANEYKWLAYKDKPNNKSFKIDPELLARLLRDTIVLKGEKQLPINLYSEDNGYANWKPGDSLRLSLIPDSSYFNGVIIYYGFARNWNQQPTRTDYKYQDGLIA